MKPLNDSSIILNGISLPNRKKLGVYRLQQDNMPCIVLNTEGIATIPNAFKGQVKVPFMAKPRRTPNAAKP